VRFVVAVWHVPRTTILIRAVVDRSASSAGRINKSYLLLHLGISYDLAGIVYRLGYAR
jgi:hypothetical protein